MKLLMINQARSRVSEKWLRKWIRGIPSALAKASPSPKKSKAKTQLARKEIVVVFATTGEMKRLNHLYRGKNYATDILSFEAAEETCLGELVICLPVVYSQSKRTGLSERGELGYMIVHGVLHLLGFDHDETKREAEMFALQDRVYGVLEGAVGLK